MALAWADSFLVLWWLIKQRFLCICFVGISIQFASDLFGAWLDEKDISTLASALKKAEMETKLLNLLPINKRTQENFENHFKAAGLNAIVDYQRQKANAVVRKDLQRKLSEMIKEEEAIKEVKTKPLLSSCETCFLARA